jgi:prepilin-type N-terminal cleavage/methylation domain-containing protein
MTPCRSPNRGFTLIELIVVIAIIAILAAILFPVFAQAREKARAAVCLSNNKQIGLSVAMYVQDYDSTFPAQRTDGLLTLTAGGKEATYYDALLPYQKNQQIWLCPSDIANTYSGYQATVAPPAMGYVMNGNVVTATGLAEAAVAAPSNCLLIRESGAGIVWKPAWLRPYRGGCDDTFCGQNGFVWVQGLGCVSPDKAGGQKAGPHMNGYNFLLADTHAKWLRPEAAIELAHFPEDTGRSTKAAHPKANPPCFP